MAVVPICLYVHLGVFMRLVCVSGRTLIRISIMPLRKIVSKSAEATIQWAYDFSKELKAGDIVLLEGDLGAGKTTFVKGLVQGLKGKIKEVNSPTFVLMNIYKGRLPVYHFDLYRLEKPQEIESLNIDEYLQADGVAVIEWPRRLGDQIPQNAYLIEFKHRSETERDICISYPLKHQPRSSR
jgi:tRNA threonylcarbamoyladenosine biosynthesis protein TsaE